MQKVNLTGVALELYQQSTPEVQREFIRLQRNKEKARELADMVGSVVIDEALPLEVLELLADCLKEDCKQIRQAAEDMKKEEQAIKRWQQEGKEGERGE